MTKTAPIVYDKLTNWKIPSTLAIALLSQSVIAAPVVNEIRQTNSTEPTYEILGDNFGAPPSVVLYDDFESGSVGGYVTPTSALIGSWSKIPEEDAQAKYFRDTDGNIGILVRDLSQPTGSQRPILTTDFLDYYQEVFIAFSVKVPDGYYFSGASSDQSFPDASSWKFVWLMSGTGLRHDDGLFDLAIPSHVGSGNFLIGGNDGTISWISGGSSWWSWHEFNNISYYMKFDPSNPTQSPILWRIISVSEKGMMDRGGETSADNFKDTDYRFNRLQVPGWWGNGDTSNFQAVYDNIYVAAGQNANARIMLTDNEELSNSTLAKTIPPISWADEKIVFDASHVPTWDQVYIHIFDSKGVKTTSGAAVCSRCPSPVTPTVE